jgi:hypothetical protein
MKVGERKYDHDKIVALFDDGVEIQDIAKRIGCTESLVSIVTTAHGRSARLRRYPHSGDWDRNAILEDYKTGVPIAEILEEHHISQTHFYRLLRETDTPRRPRPSLAGRKNGQYKHGLGSRSNERRRYLKQQVAAICLGHIVPLGWNIHHMDEDPTNNNPENLALFPSSSAHSRYHQQLLCLQREGAEVDAIQLVLKNGGQMLPLPDHPIALPHETDRLGPHEKRK